MAPFFCKELRCARNPRILADTKPNIKRQSPQLIYGLNGRKVFPYFSLYLSTSGTAKQLKELNR